MITDEILDLLKGIKGVKGYAGIPGFQGVKVCLHYFFLDSFILD